MKIFSLLLPAALFAGSASAANYDYSLNGESACVLINIAMDESGSMQTEQEWMQTVAIPAMITKLESDTYGYDYVFVCSHGFGEDSANEDAVTHGFRTVGCSNGYDSTILEWDADNSADTEDGYHAIEKAIEDVPAIIDGLDLAATCKTMDKNMILVTDEVRWTIVGQLHSTHIPLHFSYILHSTSYITYSPPQLTPFSHFNF
jgi:hypothetical protein